MHVMLCSTVSYIYITAFPSPWQGSTYLGQVHNEMALHMQMHILLPYWHSMNKSNGQSTPVEHD